MPDKQTNMEPDLASKIPKPKISILTATLPSAGRKHLLHQTWESIKTQQQTDWEWLIQVDGEHDFERSCLPKDMQNDHRVQIEETKKQCGLFVARNRLALRAQSPLLVFLDDDDLLAEGALNFWLNTFFQHPHVDWVSGGLVVFDQEGFQESFVPQVPEGVVEPGAGLQAWPQDEDVFPLVLNTTAIKKKAFFLAGGVPALRQCGDLALVLRLSCLFAGFASYESVIYYRSHEHQWTKSPDWWQIEMPERKWVRESVQMFQNSAFRSGL